MVQGTLAFKHNLHHIYIGSSERGRNIIMLNLITIQRQLEMNIDSLIS